MREGHAHPKLTAWLQLLRVPNLFTVPGDPLAGFSLAAVAVNSEVSFCSIVQGFCKTTILIWKKTVKIARLVLSPVIA
jgi:hypothetical protein